MSQNVVRIADRDGMDKNKALDAALAQIERAFGRWPEALNEIFIRVGLVELDRCDTSRVIGPDQRLCDSGCHERFADTGRTLENEVLFLEQGVESLVELGFRHE